MFRSRVFTLRPPRHGLLRVLGGFLGAVLLVGLLAFGFVALLALLAVGGVVWLVRQLQQPARAPAQAAPPPPPAGVLEGEFVVVQERPATKA